MKRWLKCSLPPENYNHWQECCQALRTLPKLRTLNIEMIIWNDWRHYNPTFLDDDALLPDDDSLHSHHVALLFIFRALVGITAEVFHLELNIELPAFVEDAINPRPFEVTVRDRPYDWTAFQ